MTTYSGSLVQLQCGQGGALQISLAYVGIAHSGWPTLGLPQPKAACTSQVHTAQAPGCSTRALSQVSPAFHAHPRSKMLRFLGVLQEHRPRWAVSSVPLAPCSGSFCLSSYAPWSYLKWTLGTLPSFLTKRLFLLIAYNH